MSGGRTYEESLEGLGLEGLGLVCSELELVDDDDDEPEDGLGVVTEGAACVTP